MADQYRYGRDDYRTRQDEDRRYEDRNRGGLFGSGRDRDRDGTDDRWDTDTRRRDERYARRAGGRDDSTYDNRDEERRVAIDETSRLISSDKVQGTAVYNLRGERLGTIRNVMIEKRRGLVEYAVMSFGGFLGMGTRYHPIPWQILRYDERLDGYVADIDERQLERGPSFRSNEEPRWDYGYARDVYGYYGVPY